MSVLEEIYSFYLKFIWSLMLDFFKSPYVVDIMIAFM